jgi:tetratricopeptide (TPR) repeat protein
MVARIALVAMLVPVISGAQTPPAPAHKHYETPVGPAQAIQPGKPVAPRLQNLGVHTFKVTTKSSRAQLFVNQGVNLAYGFNHAEAARAFAEAARLDPNCAMAYWGHALVLGPNINAGMDPQDEPKARELVDRALALKNRVTPRERAYIDALAQRYTGNAADRAKADRAFADAMRKVSQAFPQDLDAKTIYAEALMDLRPWNYWTRDGQPYPETVEVQRALEHVIAKNPNHPGALHYWTHVWEPTDTPERAEAEADRLLTLMPGAGHVVHMPAHIYARVGRHADVVRSNQLAVKADEDYIAQCRAQGMYPVTYYPHNIHFIWMGATATGQRVLALESARKVAASIPDEALKNVPILQGFLVVPYWAMVRFEQWDEILNNKGPRHESAFTRGVWRFARAMALTAKSQLADAENELTELRRLVDDPLLKGSTTFSTNTGYAILRIAPEVVAGEIAAKRKEWDRAILHFDRAVRYEDALVYQEPPDWPAPVRQNLGAVLVQAGRADEAEAVYWEDLRNNPGNGWSLRGLMQALEAQGKKDEAARVRGRFAEAWKYADAEIKSFSTGDQEIKRN